jgi:hypothetical protein
MADRPDWGHGPNAPVLTFTEDEIRAAMADHGPFADTDTGELICDSDEHSISSGDCWVRWDIDHLINALKKARE